MKRFLFAIVMVLVGASAGRAWSADSSSNYTCRIVKDEIKAVGRGATLREAQENAQLQCGQQAIENHYDQFGDVDPNADLELSCINLDCQ